jgi:hypothetical protein
MIVNMRKLSRSERYEYFSAHDGRRSGCYRLVAAQERVPRPCPECVNALEACLLHPTQLNGKRRRFVHRIGMIIYVPALA